MENSRKPSLILLILAGVALIAFLHAYQLPENTRLWKAMGDAGHIPIFGFLSLILLAISGRLFDKRFKNPLAHYFLAFFVSVLIGTTSEIIQIFEPRDADILDLIRDAAGSITFLGLYYLIDPGVLKQRLRLSSRSRILIWAGCVIILLAALYQLAFVITGYIKRDRAFPSICSFDQSWEKVFWIRHDTEVKVVNPPDGWVHPQNDRVGELSFAPVVYPGFHIQEPFPDWRGYDFLKFEIYSAHDTAIGLYFRLHDKHHNKDFNDRYNNHFSIEPGLNSISIPISDIKNAPSGRNMDMAAIRTFGIFAYRPAEPFKLYLDNFRLEKSGDR